MPRAPLTVLEAALSYQRGSENRLTAILAAVLDQHHRLASELFALLELPPAQRYRVYTEIWVTPTRRVDMQVIGSDSAGGDVAQVWSEHKGHGGAFSTRQREDYLAALEAQGGGRLVTIIPNLRHDEEAGDSRALPADQRDGLPVRSGEASDDEPRWWGLDWQLVAELAYGVGESEPGEWGGRDWQSKALRSDAPASHRALCELVWYLEQEGYAVTTPLNHDHVQALKHAPHMMLAVATMLKRAADEMTALKPKGDVDFYGAGFGQYFELPASSWPPRFDASGDLVAYFDDAWVDEPAGEPCIAAGVSVSSDWYRPLSAQSAWVGRLHAAGFSLSEFEQHIVIYSTTALADVMAHGNTMAAQARFVAQWADPLLRRLVSDEFDPGPLSKPPKPHRGRRGRGT